MTEVAIPAGTSGVSRTARRPAWSLLPISLAAFIGMVVSTGAAAEVTVKAEEFQKTESPWDMAFLPDGTMFFTEKCKGLSVRLPSGKVNALLGVGGSTGYATMKADLFCDGQAGVQGVAVDPQFATNRFVYLYSSSKGSNRTYGGYNNIVMRMKKRRSAPRRSARLPTQFVRARLALKNRKTTKARTLKYCWKL